MSENDYVFGKKHYYFLVGWDRSTRPPVRIVEIGDMMDENEYKDGDDLSHRRMFPPFRDNMPRGLAIENFRFPICKDEGDGGYLDKLHRICMKYLTPRDGEGCDGMCRDGDDTTSFPYKRFRLSEHNEDTTYPYEQFRMNEDNVVNMKCFDELLNELVDDYEEQKENINPTFLMVQVNNCPRAWSRRFDEEW